MYHPPFCPHRGCPAHFTPPRARWWARRGFYTSRCGGRVQRYRCRLCGRSFSRQSFSIDYYAKRRLSYRQLQRLLRSCCGIRQSARLLGVYPATVLNKIMRLSRQAIAAHAGLLDRIELEEDLAADGLESYWCSQYFPNNFTVLLGAESRFLFDWEAVTLRRSGRMSEGQNGRRAELEQRWSADPEATYRSFGRILTTATGLIEVSRRRQPVILSTDCHTAYRRVFDEHPQWQELLQAGRCGHLSVSSRRARTAANPLNPVNTFDRQIRNDMAEHVRETIRFARNRAHSLERFAVSAFDYNYCKRYRVNQPAGDGQTHAEVAGVAPEAVQRARRQLCRQRAFLSRTVLTLSQIAVWLRIERTPLKERDEYLPAYLLA
jgi:hypothetical protein